MSGCSNEEEEISFSESDRHGYEGGSDDDDSEIGKNEHRSSRRRRMGSGFGKVVVHQFTKAKKQVRRISSRKSLVPKPKGKVVNVEGGVSGRSGCRFCFSRPKVLESLYEESPTSDPNDPNFTHAMLTTLLDTNDFYSKECNPHLDLD
ncbi:hypothetical protein AAZX31_03G207200 [Glycine max]|uniref:Uncharacterized protein n=2 Tax=Glycine subgen. Soja TaxID=1462606 RepID=K7KGH9_SOYBN|nr:uncharacterized protein LOC102669075 [Glycine max]XP_028226422.1 uncharacterized protein LOC114407503 [Glycine soja]KAG5044192.1 hypothetical protein JHK87_008107 [Glycine soja]KAG5073055.1 hypothetical protein JHK86_008266 [Glycine max]KAH1071371.1 hypothetical protein GYH30_008083 [Glycine max]KAH1259176.1 hypothetical protein GmHk_03G008712 [Glycine max]KHN14197.1 hypothetical protein glysoja_028595 [Glycine soja]|eukprot:XP_006577195.1 uncharacterized protein LOC102669075 [Glycine max]